MSNPLQSGFFACLRHGPDGVLKKGGLHHGTYLHHCRPVWLGLAVISAVVAYHLRVSIARVEICVGVIAAAVAGYLGKSDALGSTLEWLRFLAASGAVLLTFLACADPPRKTTRLLTPKNYLQNVKCFSVSYEVSF